MSQEQTTGRHDLSSSSSFAFWAEKMPFHPPQKLSEPDNPHLLPPLSPLSPSVEKCHSLCHSHGGFSTYWDLQRIQTMDQNEHREGGWGPQLRKKELMQMSHFSGNSSVLPVRQIIPPSAGVWPSIKAFSMS